MFTENVKPRMRVNIEGRYVLDEGVSTRRVTNIFLLILRSFLLAHELKFPGLSVLLQLSLGAKLAAVYSTI